MNPRLLFELDTEQFQLGSSEFLFKEVAAVQFAGEEFLLMDWNSFAFNGNVNGLLGLEKRPEAVTHGHGTGACGDDFRRLV